MLPEMWAARRTNALIFTSHVRKEVGEKRRDASRVYYNICNDAWWGIMDNKSKRHTAEDNGKLNWLMECGSKLGRRLHQVSPHSLSYWQQQHESCCEAEMLLSGAPASSFFVIKKERAACYYTSHSVDYFICVSFKTLSNRCPTCQMWWSCFSPSSSRTGSNAVRACFSSPPVKISGFYTFNTSGCFSFASHVLRLQPPLVNDFRDKTRQQLTRLPWVYSPQRADSVSSTKQNEPDIAEETIAWLPSPGDTRILWAWKRITRS